MFYKPFFGKKTHTHTTSPINASDIKKTKKIIFLFYQKDNFFTRHVCARDCAVLARIRARICGVFARKIILLQICTFFGKT